MRNRSVGEPAIVFEPYAVAAQRELGRGHNHGRKRATEWQSGSLLLENRRSEILGVVGIDLGRWLSIATLARRRRLPGGHGYGTTLPARPEQYVLQTNQLATSELRAAE